MKARKIIGIVLEVILCLILAFAVFLLVVSIVSKRDSDGAVNIFGHDMRIVVSSSMEHSEYTPDDVKHYDIGEIKVKSMVYVERVPENEAEAKEWYSALKVGDVLTFRYVSGATQETVTHRICAIEQTENGYVIDLRGDNRTQNSTVSTQRIYTSAEDYPNSNAMYNYVIGKVTGTSTFLGYAVYALKQPVGIALIIILPCAIIIVWQVIRIVMLVSGKNKQDAEDEKTKQAAELEELRKKLAALEGNNTVIPSAAEESSPVPVIARSDSDEAIRDSRKVSHDGDCRARKLARNDGDPEKSPAVPVIARSDSDEAIRDSRNISPEDTAP